MNEREKENETLTHYVNACECDCAMTNAPVDFSVRCVMRFLGRVDRHKEKKGDTFQCKKLSTHTQPHRDIFFSSYSCICIMNAAILGGKINEITANRRRRCC